ncbi:MAG: sulfite oxidase-like oxidoreductase [Actinobacteria bacterium]|nr:MAG: sulfite oxidase-like oxidoreductase [Actinomycetota bacterium]
MNKPKFIKSPDILRTNRVPPGQHVTERWPTLHHGQTPQIDTKSWQFRIFGLVDEEKTLNYDEFIALPNIKVLSDIHCVTTWSRLNNLWEGISTSVLKDLASIQAEAKYVLVHAAGGFTTNLSLEDFFAEDVLFALKHDGQPLSSEHGGPVRLVVPRLYFWKSAKWVNGIEFLDKNQPGFWEAGGYHMHGDPWKEERYA